MLTSIIIHAAMRLALLISKVLAAARALKDKLFHESLEKEYGTKATVKEETITAVDTTLITEKVKEPEPPTLILTVPEEEVLEQTKPQIPPRPIMPSEAATYPKLHKIKDTLDKHNHLIFEAERATDAYETACDKWEEAYGEKTTPKAETLHEKLQRYQEKADRQNANRPYQRRDKWAR